MLDQKKIGVRIQDVSVMYNIGAETGINGFHFYFLRQLLYITGIFTCDRSRTKRDVTEYTFESGSCASCIDRLSFIWLLLRGKIHTLGADSAILLRAKDP